MAHAKAAAGEALALNSLADQPFVLHPAVLGGGLHEHILALCSGLALCRASPSRHARPRPCWLALVAAGLGLSIVPSVHERICPPGVVLQPLADARAIRASRWSACSRRRHPAMQMFWQLLRWAAFAGISPREYRRLG